MSNALGLARNATGTPPIVIRCRLVLAATLLLAGLSGCATWKGAPKAPFDEDSFTGANSPISLTPTDLQELLDTQDEGRRNALLRRTMADINVIRFHEASLWKLSDIALDGRINMATFVPADDVPNDLEFVANTAQAPANCTLVWKGTLRYNSAEQTIALYRAN